MSFKKGNIPWNKGKKTGQKAWNKGLEGFGRWNKGNKNGMWKGEKVGYHALHSWITRNKPKPKFCEKCGKRKSLDLANISGKYKRDINDFEWLCRKCHMKKDGRLNKLKIGLRKCKVKFRGMLIEGSITRKVLHLNSLRG